MLRLAAPLALAELGWMFMGIVDTMMAELGSPSDALLVLGMSMYEGDDDIIDNIVFRMPDAIRADIRDTAAMAYAEHAQRIHGTTTPRRSAEIRRAIGPQ